MNRGPASRPSGNKADRGGSRPSAQRHRDRNRDGKPDRHFRWRNRAWWPYYFGYGAGAFGFRSPFYDPFYSGFYSDGVSERETSGSKNVVVKVKPESAQVHVNGLLYSNRGRTSFDLPMGQWTIEISAPGYRTETISLNVQQGVRYEIERKLEKDPTMDRRGRPLKAEELAPP